MFYYNDYKGKHVISLKKACPEWVNSDCVPIYYKDGSKVLENSLYGWDFNAFDVITIEQVRKFINKSDRAFCKKYPQLGYKPGNLLSGFDKSVTV